MAGGDVDWSAFYQDQLRSRAAMPVYAFDRQEHWIAPGASGRQPADDALVKREDLSDWFHTAGFQDAPLIDRAPGAPAQTWLIVSENAALARALAASPGVPAHVIASHAKHMDVRHETAWTLDFDEPSQFEALLIAFERRHGAPDRIVFLASEARHRNSDAARRCHFNHPLHLLQALGSQAGTADLTFVTHGLSDAGGTALVPEHALVLGPAFVAPRELPGLSVRCIDVPRGAVRSSGRLRNRLCAELRARTTERLVALRQGQRLVHRLAPLTLPEPDGEPGQWLRDDGVYVITGGLGGMALEIARHMAQQKKIKLALLGRTGLPEGEEAGLIRARREPAYLFERLTRIDALRAAGAQVQVFACDITDTASLSKALGAVRAACGPIHGVIHAAGVIDDAPLMSKSAGDAARILAPKLEGTRALDHCVHEDLDVFLLFSSVASYLGLPGQADYAAGNAFLDAFARERAQRAAGRTLVVNWNAWRDTGMAESQRRRHRIGEDPHHPCASALFEGYTESGGARLYAASFRPKRDWLFTEHEVMGGQTLLPGTAFVELARAAVADWTASPAIELTDLSMLAPFQSGAFETQRLIVRVAPTAKGFDVALYAADDAKAAPLVTCEARVLTPQTSKRVDLGACARRCDHAIETPADGFLDQVFMKFGPRWANLESIRYGEAEALVSLRLPAAFESDLDTFVLHPALLDMATGAVQPLIGQFDKTRDFFVPVGYEIGFGLCADARARDEPCAL